MALPHKHSKLRFRENYMTLRKTACATILMGAGTVQVCTSCAQRTTWRRARQILERNFLLD
jgi:hypothetical protein